MMVRDERLIPSLQVRLGWSMTPEGRHCYGLKQMNLCKRSMSLDRNPIAYETRKESIKSNFFPLWILESTTNKWDVISFQTY